MVVKAFQQVQLPNDPAAVLQASTKQYADTKVPSSRQVIAGTGLAGGGDLSADRTLSAALVTSPPYTKTWASTISIDPTAGNNVNITATAATSLSISTTGALDGQMILVSILASGGSWAITLTSTTLTTGLASPVTIASGKVGFLGYRYSGLLSAWVLLAQTASL